jgi:hypothetical protein
MSKFSPGEQVGFLYEKGTALIIEYIGYKNVKIINNDGFEEVRPENDLIKIYNTEYILPNNDVFINKTTSSKPKQSPKSQTKRENFWEIDLHYERLFNDKSLNHTEILLKQFIQFKNTFNKAKTQRINKLVVIHGVGEGVLKNEIRMFLAKQENIEFYDASYIEYGKGATEIRFYYLN